MLNDEKRAGCEAYLQRMIGTAASAMLVCVWHADISLCLFMTAWRCELAARAFVDEQIVIQRFLSP